MSRRRSFKACVLFVAFPEAALRVRGARNEDCPVSACPAFAAGTSKEELKSETSNNYFTSLLSNGLLTDGRRVHGVLSHRDPSSAGRSR